jgi:Skp family chaperone for outer membrane proteins
MSHCRFVVSILISLLLQICIIQGSEIKSFVNRNDLSVVIKPSILLNYRDCRNIVLRGGGSSDTESDGEETDDEEDNESISHDDKDESGIQLSNNVENMKDALTATTKLLGKIALFSFQAISRAVQAAMMSLKKEDSKEENTISKVISILQDMWKAAITAVPLNDDIVNRNDSSKSVDTGIESTNIENSDENENISFDFGKFLSNTYGIDDNRNENSSPILSGPISDALSYARNNARLLVTFIPAKGPQSKSKDTSDNTAIHSLLSSEVSQVIDKRSRKNAVTGSFYIWAAKAGSPDAVLASKRLKIKAVKGKQKPTLAVAYPAIAMGPSGIPKIVPKVLAQHHCSPPPSPEAMSAWLTTLRKRHSKQYAAMLHDLKEAQLLRERQQGYKSSILSDKQRQEEEERLEAERLANEQAEQERVIAIEKRRKELRISLPEEIDADSSTTAILIAVRFADGRKGQRRFESSTPLSTVFNWIDAYFEMERERVILTTMNGKQSFSWDEDESSTLVGEGFRRNAAFRVIETTFSNTLNVTKAE